ncbi:MAG: hypothetical protein AMXMBFR13_14540 [Phycisphaerae bacterium]
MNPSVLLCISAGLITSVGAGQSTRPADTTGVRPLIEMAILLDTSNSMDGLIAQAKSQLWTVVNQFITADRNGKQPELHVALYEYGNNRLSKESGHIRQVLPLTTDLDKVSEELFALTTLGGQEYCGQVIESAVKNLVWNPGGDVLKVIFIAGNEPFTQGPVDFRKSCQAAVERGITINTIFCGPDAEGVRTLWKDGAVLADGAYVSIDQNRVVQEPEAPQDREIARLGAEINKTYVPYGTDGRRGSANQMAQDSNAFGLSNNVAVQRAMTKGSAQYLNVGWDLVDAVKQGGVKIEDVKPDLLPEELRGMTVQERKSWLEAKSKERTAIQKKIGELSAQRSRYLAELARKATATAPAGDSLDAAMIKSLREQAKRKHINMR